MSKINMYDYQMEAIDQMHNGCILCGGVGSGKSRTSLAYYYLQNGGSRAALEDPKARYSRMENPKDLYIITTARKRDTHEWDQEMVPFLLSQNPDGTPYHNKVVVDSWNNIKKYVKVENAFFIFDEQRVVGWGTWSKSFIRIARFNDWILLSATPGDCWSDYIPVFVANGFYKNKSDFVNRHIIYSYYTKYPQISRYVDEGRLNRYRQSILVTMGFERKTVSHHEDVYCNYDFMVYKTLHRERFNIDEGSPIENASELCYQLRKVVNADESRAVECIRLVEKHPKAIIFYNFDYELEILREAAWPEGTLVAEWNGHRHEPIPEGSRWVYLVQYTAGAEGWNCVRTDTVIFYSQNYSYRTTIQASGRIDRLNTPFTDLYYYHLKSRSGIDLAISKALKNKRNFNERMFCRK